MRKTSYVIYFLISYFILCSTCAQATDYSVNLMWINESLDPTEKYIVPAHGQIDLKTKLVTPVKSWLSKTGSHKDVNFWYDSEMTSPEALENTKKLFPNDASLRFKDIRELPEVREYPEVFSNKTPVYFRADLLRVLAAYHSVLSQPKETFVYADLDVKPMSEEKLFDEETKENLRDFGIVLARGGLLGFENSFQITAFNPKLLKAMKRALIDISIARANHILNGGYWAYQNSYDTTPLTQSVYDTLNQNMFPYYYYLQGWANMDQESLGIKIPASKTLEAYIEGPGGDNVFGLQSINNLPTKTISDKINNKEKFDFEGKLSAPYGIKIPTKIIDAPPSRFGGQPTKLNPDEITPQNYDHKLNLALTNNNNLAVYLYLAVKNNYVTALDTIIGKLSPDDLVKAFLSVIEKYSSSRGEATALYAAIGEDNAEVIKKITDKLAGRPELIQAIAEKLSGNFNYELTHLSHAAQNEYRELLHTIAAIFVDNISVQEAIGHALMDLPNISEKDLALFKRILKTVPTILEAVPKGEPLAIKAAREGHWEIINELVSIAPQALAMKNDDGEFPLLLIIENVPPRVFRAVWNARPQMIYAVDKRGNSLAHAAAKSQYGSDVLTMLAKDAPEMLFKRNNAGKIPATIAASYSNSPELEVIINTSPEAVLAEFREVLDAAKRCYDCLLLLAKKFPDHKPEIVLTAKSLKYSPYTPMQIQQLEN